MLVSPIFIQLLAEQLSRVRADAPAEREMRPGGESEGAGHDGSAPASWLKIRIITVPRTAEDEPDDDEVETQRPRT
jgi:hypothetical protein